jgi:hypothetical protein
VVRNDSPGQFADTGGQFIQLAFNPHQKERGYYNGKAQVPDELENIFHQQNPLLFFDGLFGPV